MGYFSNNTEGDMYEAKYCSKCVHQKEELGEECPILVAHAFFNYDQEGDLEAVLNMMIPRKGISNQQCTMFHPNP
jgi:hypothetical protein